MTAEDIANVLGGRRAGASWMARCPAHNDREPSLSIRQAEDGTVLVRCHAGCEQARVITALRSLAANGYGLSRRRDPPQQPKSQIRSRRSSSPSSGNAHEPH
jgi:putative DNA primase/helicase